MSFDSEFSLFLSFHNKNEHHFGLHNGGKE